MWIEHFLFHLSIGVLWGLSSFDLVFQKEAQNFSLKKDEVVAMYGVMGAKYKEDEK